MPDVRFGALRLVRINPDVQDQCISKAAIEEATRPAERTTRPLRYLFVCAGGIDRSPTAAAAAKAMAKERGRIIEAKHLGLYDAMTTNFLPPDVLGSDVYPPA